MQDLDGRLGRGVAVVAALVALGCAADSGRTNEGGGGIGLDSQGSTGPSADDGPAGSSGEAADTEADPDPNGDGPAPADPDSGPELPYDPQQLGKLCARGNADRVAQALCSGATVQSMEDLHEVLAFERPFFALTGNSSSLVAADVSAINPRLIVGEALAESAFEPVGSFEHLMALGFARGEQLVELVGFDPIADELNFYLLKFEQACNDTGQGCSAADLVTPAVEQDWTRWTVYQDTDLANTTVDCAVCHQPMGPGTPKILRMQELRNSWTHWFPTRPPSAQTGGWATGEQGTHGIPPSDDTHGTHTSEVLWPQFERMHALEDTYGGVPIDELSQAEAGPDLEAFVASFMLSRNLPPQLQLHEGLLGDEGEGGGGAWTMDTAATELVGPTFSWQQQFEEVVAGQRLPLPSFQIDISDATVREAAIDSYLGVLTGTLPDDELVDPRDVASAQARLEMSLLPRPEASAEEILTHMCSRCHNDQLDPTLSRARFDANALATADAATKSAIASRLVLDHDDRLVMPPPRFGTLPPWAIDRVLAWTEQ